MFAIDQLIEREGNGTNATPVSTIWLQQIIAMGRIGFILQEAQLILTMAPFKDNKEMHRSVTCNETFPGGRHQRNIYWYMLRDWYFWTGDTNQFWNDLTCAALVIQRVTCKGSRVGTLACDIQMCVGLVALSGLGWPHICVCVSPNAQRQHLSLSLSWLALFVPSVCCPTNYATHLCKYMY